MRWRPNSAPGAALPGKVVRVDLQSDAVTEERIVNVAFDPAPVQLYLGELAEVSIRLSGLRDVLTVPRAALAQFGGQTGVWQIEAGRARFRPVQPGLQTAEQVQIVSGLQAGDRLVALLADKAHPLSKAGELLFDPCPRRTIADDDQQPTPFGQH